MFFKDIVIMSETLLYRIFTGSTRLDGNAIGRFYLFFSPVNYKTAL